MAVTFIYAVYAWYSISITKYHKSGYDMHN